MTATVTYAEVAERTGVEIPPHLEASMTVPRAEKFWRQGDVYVMRHVAGPQGEGIPLTGEGHKVVKGDADRNSHILNGDGRFHPGTYRHTTLDYGLLVVPEVTEDGREGAAVLTHTGEHGSIAFGPGTWRLWGQGSHESELRRAAD